MSALKARTASCRCGRLKATLIGEPVRVSICHCLDCKKRSGSVFAVQARWPADRVTIEGRSKAHVNIADSGNRITFHFCPDCGSDVHYEIEGKFDGLVAIPLGAFDDPYAFAPKFSVWEERKHDWVEIVGDDVEHSTEISSPGFPGEGNRRRRWRGSRPSSPKNPSVSALRCH